MAARLTAFARLSSFASRIRSVDIRLPGLGTDRGPRAWKRFRVAVEKKGRPLLEKLPSFPNSVLVSGCQRSGTTVLTNMLLGSAGLVDYRRRGDSELEGAWILSGLQEPPAYGRTVFQTTFVNNSPHEYDSAPGDTGLIWMIRRPESVVFSMLYNWHGVALDRLFLACGTPHLTDAEAWRFRRFGLRGIPPLARACAAYLGKSAQLAFLRPLFGSRLLVVDYDTLVEAPHAQLTVITRFANLSTPPDVHRHLHTRSKDKAAALSPSKRALVEERCAPAYRSACRLIQTSPSPGHEPP